MIKEFIGTGKTREEATLCAKTGLNAPETADIKIEVIAMPQKKFLGIFGGSDAKVKASYDDGKKEVQAEKVVDKKVESKNEAKKSSPKQQQNQPKSAPKKSTPANKKSTPAPTKAQKPQEEPAQKVDTEYAVAYLQSILKGFNVDDAKVSATYHKSILDMEIDCENYGIIIGRRGETLDAIQYLLNLAVKKTSNGYVRVVLNVGNYREKRGETLKNLAKKNAAYVLRSGRRYTFEPMNPYERRIIHTTVQEIEGVESRSVGSNQDRKVIIEPVGGVKQRSNPRYNNYKSAPKTSAPAPKKAKSDFTKFGKIEVNKD